MATTEEVQAYIKAQVDAAVAHALSQVVSPTTNIKPVKPEALFGKPNENVRQWIFSVELWFTAGHVCNEGKTQGCQGQRSQGTRDKGSRCSGLKGFEGLLTFRGVVQGEEELGEFNG